MSEKEKPTLPKTGKGSQAGPRWFVSKHPALALEVVAERYPDKDGNRAEFIRVAFKSEIKSEIHAGEGYLGSRNKLGTDTNANRHYGLFFIVDPGPTPKDGFKDDQEAIEYKRQDGSVVVHEDWMMTAEEKTKARRIIDHIRRTGIYRNTPQDDQYRVTSRLVELSWDPAEIRTYVNGMVIPGMGKPMARPPHAGAPEDAPAAAVTTGAGPRMGTQVNRRSANP